MNDNNNESFRAMELCVYEICDRERDFNVLTSNEAIIQANDGNKEITTTRMNLSISASLSFSVSISVESNGLIRTTLSTTHRAEKKLY